MLSGFMSMLLIFLFLILLIIGLILCRKHLFTAGFYFFLILILNKVLSFIYSAYIAKYIDSLHESNKQPPLGMTIGELVSWFSLIPTIIELIAFAILIIGLYTLWKSKAQSSKSAS